MVLDAVMEGGRELEEEERKGGFTDEEVSEIFPETTCFSSSISLSLFFFLFFFGGFFFIIGAVGTGYSLVRLTVGEDMFAIIRKFKMNNLSRRDGIRRNSIT